MPQPAQISVEIQTLNIAEFEVKIGRPLGNSLQVVRGGTDIGTPGLGGGAGAGFNQGLN